MKDTDPVTVPRLGAPARYGWNFLAFLCLLLTWAGISGRYWVWGPPDSLLEDVVRAYGWSPGEPSHLSAWLVRLPGDTFFWITLLTTSAVVGAGLVAYLAFRSLWKNPISPVLALGALLLSPTVCWIATQNPGSAIVHLLEACALAALVLGKVGLLSGLVLALTAVNPAAGLAFYIPLVVLALRRYETYGAVVTGASIVGTGALLVPMASDFRLSPALTGFGWWTTLPLLLLFWPQEIREERRGLYLGLLGGALLAGRSEFATAVALGDLALILLQRIRSGDSSPSQELPPGTWRLPTLTMFGLAALVVLVNLVLPGERYLNRRILIPAQKRDISFLTLLLPFDLTHHARHLEEQPWRQNAPFPNLKPEDVKAALEMTGQPFAVVTVDRLAENRNLSLLYALLAGQPLVGWDDSGRLIGPLLLAKELGRNILVDGPTLVVRHNDGKVDIQPGLATSELPEALPRVDFRSLINAPYMKQQVSRQAGAGYLWVENGKSYKLFFADEPAVVGFGPEPETVKLIALDNEKNSRTLEIHETHLVLEFDGVDEVLPSRSLVPLEMYLVNRGEGAVSSEGIQALRLGSALGASFSAFDQPLSQEFVLFPKEAIPLTLYLATPEPEGTFPISALVVTPANREVDLPIEGPNVVQTWRRLPPVGTWVEPEQPSPSSSPAP